MNDIMIKNEKIDLRNAFFDKMYEIALENDDLVFLTGDISAHSLPKFREKFPLRFYNTGIKLGGKDEGAPGIRSGDYYCYFLQLHPYNIYKLEHQDLSHHKKYIHMLLYNSY